MAGGAEHHYAGAELRARTRRCLVWCEKGLISVYAQRRDYHDVVKKAEKAGPLAGCATRLRGKGFCRYGAGDGKTAESRRSRLARQTHEFGVA